VNKWISRFARALVGCAGMLVLAACGGGGGGGGGSSPPPPNPAPIIASLSPASTTAPGAAFTITVNGTNFISGSQVQWNGSSRSTTYISATQLTAAITSADITTAGTAKVTVVNPAPGGGTSTAQIFTVDNPVPTVSAVSPNSVSAGGGAVTLTVTGSHFVTSSQVQWNGTGRTTTYVSSSELQVALSSADVATPSANAITVTTPSPGGGTSGAASISALWPKPAGGSNGYLIDAAVNLSSLAAINSLGGPLLTAWNPTSANGAGMDILMFGTPDASCPQSATGPLSSFPDSVLTDDAYSGSPTQVPSALRFWSTPAPTCSAAAATLAGPSNVFMDGSALWFATLSLGKPTDLLKPFSSSGQNGSGADASILDTSVDFRLAYPGTTLAPWAQSGRARIATLAQVVTLQSADASALTQVKQTIGATLINATCRAANPTNNCQIILQWSVAIAQSNVSDWSTASDPPDIFLDPAQGNIPVVAADLFPAFGGTVSDSKSGLPLFTSQGPATEHAAFGPTQFDLEIDFPQFENAVRITSALILSQSVGTDAGCAQCVQVFGSGWNDPSAWLLLSLYSHQEDYDASGVSGDIFGGFQWLYAGAAP
jgi:hypothetical protein